MTHKHDWRLAACSEEVPPYKERQPWFSSAPSKPEIPAIPARALMTCPECGSCMFLHIDESVSEAEQRQGQAPRT